MNKNIKDLDKYSEISGSIKLKKEVSELVKWQDLEEILHEAKKQSGDDISKWEKITNRKRGFDCFITEVENAIKELGGKVLRERGSGLKCFACGRECGGLEHGGTYGITKDGKNVCFGCSNDGKIAECKKCEKTFKIEEVKNNYCSICFVPNSNFEFPKKMIYKPGDCGCKICDIPQAIEETKKDLKSLQDWEANVRTQLESDLVILEKELKKGAVCEGDHSYNNSWAGRSAWDYTGITCLECGKEISKTNSWGDNWRDENHSCSENGKKPKKPINTPQINQFLSTLQTLQSYFITNNIHSITNQNDNLVITFNSNPTSPLPPTIITNSQITSSDSSLSSKERTMWRGFKDYLNKKNKNSINKQELETEIKKLSEEQETQKPNSKTPWIIGGSIFGGIVILGIIWVVVRNKRNRKIGKTKF